MRGKSPESELSVSVLPLSGKTALVTGVSRRRGIGFAVARTFAEMGASVFIQHYRPHDVQQPWGGDDIEALSVELRGSVRDGALFGEREVDLSDETLVPELIDAARSLTGSVDILVCNHAKSGDDGGILDMTPERLDAFWNVNTRSTLLLTAAFARSHRPEVARNPQQPGERLAPAGPFAQPVGKVFWMTSGQIHGAMRGEVAYAASKAALAGVTPTVAAELLDLGIILNTIDPGPVNTGYMDPESSDRPLDALDEYLATTPFGRVGRASDPAKFIGWLASDEGSWIVGQVLTIDGGFSTL